MLPSGKPDYPAVRDRARASNTNEHSVVGLRELFADVLQIDAASIDPDASFVDLGGNSLSYVTMSVRLERALARLPSDWQRLPASGAGSHAQVGATVAAVVGCDAGDQRRTARVAIVLIVGSHAEMFELWGGAHVLLGIAGYNFGRFCLTPVPRTGPGAAPAQHHRVDRGTVGGVGRDRADDHRRLHADESVAGQQVPRPARQHDRRSAVVRRGACVDSCRAGRVVLAARRGPTGTAVGPSPSRWRSWPSGWRCATTSSACTSGHDAWFTVLAFWFFAVGWAAAKASTTLQRAAVTVRADRRPARLLRPHRTRIGGAGRVCPADLVARAALPARGHRCRRGYRGGVAVHLPHPLPGLPAVRRTSTAWCRRVDCHRCAADTTRVGAAVATVC